MLSNHIKFVIVRACEMNARRTLSPTLQKMASDIIVDPYGASDWRCWTELLDLARKRNREMLQDILTPEEFRGWLKGSMFKYFCRAGKKPGEPYERDMAKCLQFNEWLKQAAAGKKINPRE